MGVCSGRPEVGDTEAFFQVRAKVVHPSYGEANIETELEQIPH